jgi:hypothetical protein
MTSAAKGNDPTEGKRVAPTWLGWVKIVFGFAIGSGIGLYSLYIAWMQPNQFSLPLWFLGGIAGWTGGILLSPTTQAERGLFTE